MIAGDTLVILSLDRLGRNYKEIVEQWQSLKKDNINCVVLDFPLLNTNFDEKSGLEKNFLSDLILSVLSYVAEKERLSIKTRQAEGIKIAKEKGVRFGRPNIKKPDNFEYVMSRYDKHELTFQQAKKELNISNGTFARWLMEHRQERKEKNGN